jgi:acyl-CoA synthetase (AMP-forming)/AMP-acid ligase II
MPEFLNIAAKLRETAARFPKQPAIVCAGGRDRFGRGVAPLTFGELEHESDALARGLAGIGVGAGKRMVLMVRPGVEFIALTFALFKVGAVVVLIDPGMGPRRIFRCLDEVEPDGFAGIPPVQALRILSIGRFRRARLNVTVGRRWFWRGPTYESLVREALAGGWNPGADGPGSPTSPFELARTRSSDPAAIIFTSGSTGKAKGVVYEHGMFAAQVEALRDFYGIEPGGVDLPGLPLFALFNSALAVTTVIPEMDPARPARVDPQKIIAAIREHRVSQAFGSPAIWNRVGRYCEARGITLPTLRRVFSAGAPVPVDVLERMNKALVHPDAEMFTPYGATEALPVTSITATGVLGRTADRTRQGAGTCVGKPLPTIRLKIIEIVEGPIASLTDARELPFDEIGEIIVQGDVVTREYFARPEATAAAKIPDGDRFWHRMGDVGYLDETGALWFCGRKSQIVETAQGRMYTDCIEPIFNGQAGVARCALVGIGPKPRQTPAIVVERELGVPDAGVPPSGGQRGDSPSNGAPHDLLADLRQLALAHPNTRRIERFLLYPGSLPVDVRHNTKINREQLAEWAEGQ